MKIAKLLVGAAAAFALTGAQAGVYDGAYQCVIQSPGSNITNLGPIYVAFFSHSDGTAGFSSLTIPGSYYIYTAMVSLGTVNGNVYNAYDGKSSMTFGASGSTTIAAWSGLLTGSGLTTASFTGSCVRIF